MKILEPNYQWKGALTSRAKTDTIVLHHAAASNCTAADIHSWHIKKGWSGIGYHYFVRKDGTVYRGRPENVVGAHTLGGYNSHSIAICFEGNFEVESMPDSQYKAGIELINDIKSRYKIDRIIGHKEARATSCPGKNFPLEQMKAAKPTGNTSSEKPRSNNNERVFAFQCASVADGIGVGKAGCDGIFGPDTSAAMKSAVVYKRANGYKLPNCTKLVQAIVGTDADGKCGPKTAEAIRRWQSDNGLTVDAAFGINCWKKWCGIK